MPGLLKAFVYVDGWNFYHAIRRPDLYPLGFCNFRKLAQNILGTRASVDKVRYFSAQDYREEVADHQQRFWLDALRSAHIDIAELGRFQYSQSKRAYEEKTTDVRLALQIADDAVLPYTTVGMVVLISADGDFVPALRRALEAKKQVKVIFPPGLSCKQLKEVDRYAESINEEDLRLALFDGEGVTEKNEPLAKALDFGWACRVRGKVEFGTRKHEYGGRTRSAG